MSFFLVWLLMFLIASFLANIIHSKQRKSTFGQERFVHVYYCQNCGLVQMEKITSCPECATDKWLYELDMITVVSDDQVMSQVRELHDEYIQNKINKTIEDEGEQSSTDSTDAPDTPGPSIELYEFSNDSDDAQSINVSQDAVTTHDTIDFMIGILKIEMDQALEQRNFELAQQLWDKIAQLEKTR